VNLNVEYVAKLARIKLTSEEEKKFSKDLSNILNHFKELQELNTQDIRPLTGGTDLKNSLREDKERALRQSTLDYTKTFPNKENGFLKVPPVFSAEGGSASGGE